MRGELPDPDIVDPSAWIEGDRLIDGLRARGLDVLVETNGMGEWTPIGKRPERGQSVTGDHEGTAGRDNPRHSTAMLRDAKVRG
jgi:hypothetical protein